MAIRIEEAGNGRLTVDVVEVFDASDASSIVKALGCAAPNAAATIGFHRARRCEPRALALLATEVVARPGRIALLGMGLHERRLLEYFGVPKQDTRGLGGSRGPQLPGNEGVSPSGGVR